MEVPGVSQHCGARKGWLPVGLSYKYQRNKRGAPKAPPRRKAPTSSLVVKTIVVLGAARLASLEIAQS